MMRLGWITDPHLNFAEENCVRRMVDTLRTAAVDQVVISGDIAESTDVGTYLRALAVELERPIHFVLGNHDFYYSSIRRVRAEVAELCRQVDQLNYLTSCDYVPLTPSAVLLGHDGWADGRAGDYERSEVVLSDYGLIAELAGLSKEARRMMLEALGDEAARHIRRVLPEAADRFERVYLLTHVPPLREACWHDGQTSDDHWAPHFTCQAVGDAILDIMPDYPRTDLTVLCGHTHGHGEAQPLDNVRILTGGAEYGCPRVSEVFDVR